jgi:hypothetical protein
MVLTRCKLSFNIFFKVWHKCYNLQTFNSTIYCPLYVNTVQSQSVCQHSAVSVCMSTQCSLSVCMSTQCSLSVCMSTQCSLSLYVNTVQSVCMSTQCSLSLHVNTVQFQSVCQHSAVSVCMSTYNRISSTVPRVGHRSVEILIICV